MKAYDLRMLALIGMFALGCAGDGLFENQARAGDLKPETMTLYPVLNYATRPTATKPCDQLLDLQIKPSTSGVGTIVLKNRFAGNCPTASASPLLPERTYLLTEATTFSCGISYTEPGENSNLPYRRILLNDYRKAPDSCWSPQENGTVLVNDYTFQELNYQQGVIRTWARARNKP